MTELRSRFAAAELFSPALGSGWLRGFRVGGDSCGFRVAVGRPGKLLLVVPVAVFQVEMSLHDDEGHFAFGLDQVDDALDAGFLDLARLALEENGELLHLAAAPRALRPIGFALGRPLIRREMASRTRSEMVSPRPRSVRSFSSMIALLGGDANAQLATFAVVDGVHRDILLLSVTMRKDLRSSSSSSSSRTGIGSPRLIYSRSSRISRRSSALDVIDEEPAVEVIHLMQNGAAEQAAGIEFEDAAVERAGLDADPLGAGDVEGEAGEAEAAFVADDLASWSA